MIGPFTKIMSGMLLDEPRLRRGVASQVLLWTAYVESPS